MTSSLTSQNIQTGNSLTSEPAEVNFTITVTRADTGKVEQYDMVGYIDPPKLITINSKENK